MPAAPSSLRVAARAAASSLPDPVLPKQHRIVDAAAFRTIMRSGRRRTGRFVVTHQAPTVRDAPARFGFIVSKAVGGAVQRNAVKRRLRSICAERVSAGAIGVDVVIRALPASAGATFAALQADVDTQLGTVAA